MLTAPMLSDPLSTADTSREVSPAPWDELGVVTPELMLTVQNVFLLSSAPAAVSTMAALAVDDPLDVALNVVELQPLVDGVARVPHTKFGNTSVSWSLIDTSALRANENPISDGADVTGLLIVRILCVNAGSSTAVDSTMAVADTSADEPANATATVRVFRFAA